MARKSHEGSRGSRPVRAVEETGVGRGGARGGGGGVGGGAHMDGERGMAGLVDDAAFAWDYAGGAARQVLKTVGGAAQRLMKTTFGGSDQMWSKPLHLAAEEHDVGSVRRMVGGVGADACDVNDLDFRGKTALHRACEYGYADVVEALLNAAEINVNKPDRDLRTALHLAAGVGRWVVVAMLLGGGGASTSGAADVTMVDGRGMTALHFACWNGHTHVVTLLLHAIRAMEGKAGADTVNRSDNYERTALYLACAHGQADAIVSDLLKMPFIDVNRPDSQGRTPLYMACHARSLDAAKHLLKDVRVHILARTRDGRTVFDELEAPDMTAEFRDTFRAALDEATRARAVLAFWALRHTDLHRNLHAKVAAFCQH